MFFRRKDQECPRNRVSANEGTSLVKDRRLAGRRSKGRFRPARADERDEQLLVDRRFHRSWPSDFDKGFVRITTL